MPQVAIIDYGVGNLRSVEKAFAATGCAGVVSADGQLLRQAERLVLPGVGAFAACMTALVERNFDKLVRERVAAGTPLLGVCVGMQLLFETSNEFGSTPGLGLLRGSVHRFPSELVVPQVGWNQVRQRAPHRLFEGINDDAFFYFVHSYYCRPAANDIVMGETDYGLDYASVVAHDNLCRAISSRKKSDGGPAIVGKLYTDSKHPAGVGD